MFSMERIVVIVFSGTKLASPISTSMFFFFGFFFACQKKIKLKRRFEHESTIKREKFIYAALNLKRYLEIIFIKLRLNSEKMRK
jgi:hypothetical protein